MPTLLRIGRYRFSFFSNERQEPPHVHVHAGSDEAKVWLNTTQLATNHGFNNHDLNEIKGIVLEHRIEWLEKWNEYFKN